MSILVPGTMMATPSKPLASGPPLISSIAGLNAEFEMDARLTACYPGTGKTFANAISAPYSAAAQTAYDLYRGADGGADDGDEPTFSTDKFTLDGGDFFAPANAAADVVPGFVNDLQSTASGAAFFVAMLYKPGDTGFKRVFCTRFKEDATQASGGVEIGVTPGSGIRVILNGGVSGQTTGAYVGTISAGTEHFIIVSYDADTGGVGIWIDSSTAVATQDFSAHDDTGGSDAGSWGVCAYNAVGGGAVAAGSEFRYLGCGAAYMTDALAAQLMALVNAR